MKIGTTRIAIACIAVAVALGGCVRTANIYSVKEAPTTNANGKPLSKAQVRAAIITAGTSLGWTIVDNGPGKLEGTLKLRTHTAVVEIPYSDHAYSLLYKSSENLQAAGDTIHNNYNGWVQNLDRAIKTEIARI
jgi:hypothetical protein